MLDPVFGDSRHTFWKAYWDLAQTARSRVEMMVLLTIVAFGLAFPVMFLWNFVGPDVFGSPEVAYWNAWAFILSMPLLITQTRWHPQGSLRPTTLDLSSTFNEFNQTLRIMGARITIGVIAAFYVALPVEHFWNSNGAGALGFQEATYWHAWAFASLLVLSLIPITTRRHRFNRN